MACLTLAMLSDAELRTDAHPELSIRLVVEGIAPDPSGGKPPERLELRLSPMVLARLGMQIRALGNAQLVQARARAERETGPERARAAEVATSDSRVDTSTLRRVVVALQNRDSPPS